MHTILDDKGATADEDQYLTTFAEGSRDAEGGANNGDQKTIRRAAL